MRFLRGKQWKIVGAQVPVQDPKKKRFTQIDLVCKDPDGVHIVVEVKTRIVSLKRHLATYHDINEKKPKAYRKVPNSLYWRHQFQLKETLGMFKNRMPKAPVRAYLLVIVEGSVMSYALKHLHPH